MLGHTTQQLSLLLTVSTSLPCSLLSAAAGWAATNIERLSLGCAADGSSGWNGRRAIHSAVSRANASGKSALAVRTWLKQGGPQPRWRVVFLTLCKAVMPQWVREKAWGLLHGSVTWGEDLATFAPERSRCYHCVARAHSAAVDCYNTRWGCECDLR